MLNTFVIVCLAIACGLLLLHIDGQKDVEACLRMNIDKPTHYRHVTFNGNYKYINHWLACEDTRGNHHEYKEPARN